MEEKKKIHPRIKIKLSLLVYTIICNIPVCFFLCLASAICAASDLEAGVLTINFRTLDWGNIALNYGVSFVLAMCIGYFIPLSDIGRWFTGLFGIEHETYTGNMRYRLLATLIISLIYHIIISPTLMVFNYFIFRTMSFGQCMINLALNAPVMILVGFTSSLLSDVTAYKIAHHIDHSF